jgi:hypothetical protein
MTTNAERAPLYLDCFELAEWLLGRFDEQAGELPDSLCRVGLELLDAVTLALKDRDREMRLELADEALIRLRQRLRLANALDRLDEDAMLHALELCDGIGRQIGGWWRSLDPV